MVFLQSLADGNGQHGCKDDGDGGVENRGRDLAEYRQQRSFGSQALLEDAAPVIGLGT